MCMVGDGSKSLDVTKMMCSSLAVHFTMPTHCCQPVVTVKYCYIVGYKFKGGLLMTVLYIRM